MCVGEKKGGGGGGGGVVEHLQVKQLKKKPLQKEHDSSGWEGPAKEIITIKDCHGYGVVVPVFSKRPGNSNPNFQE